MLTLVLDMGYQPVNTVPFTKALRYIVKGKVDVLESYDLPIHPDWQMPAVVRLTNWISGRRNRVKFSRQNVLARDRWRCQYCGARRPTNELTFDHVIPRSRGGRTKWENIVIACIDCNHRKGDRTPHEVGLKLRTKPVRPTWLPMFNMGIRQVESIPDEWKDYWIVELSR
ncbi:MAG: HNH endonuclease [Deltaproteobacteria bacterium]|nr:HNH endonuclease [Deltaproteobacteria bacterium]